ncbi:aminotransferase class I/II-fold pyridoxal phosphate-dependent enzyme [Nocardia beijingensis]|uniref:aminotransferase class I/II-fold pyridoxal phosphate-dependent enzyme n=1 Tax=Nocardia beijingensis TaxID=95162 RepID=UPI0018942690|nr:aminotransferase class I/II-fold pyridoxal phosphate-dependent enzyme [Nocardia beijingensis]MBF6073066.1 aminotransferase class I/II-fold pyridoxal phosphate-dependent enzyme [Nocardia beijingensis]
MTAPDLAHGENFSLEHYLDPTAHTFEQRFAEFRPYAEHARGSGFVLREVAGPSGAVVPVRDPATGATDELIMLGSNNYLGLGNEPRIAEAAIAAIREYGVGHGGPPLLNGTTTLHRRLEERLAELKGSEAAMLFSSGYAANVGWVTGLLRKGDVLLYDEQNHASLYDGIQLGRVRSMAFAHNDLRHLRHRLMQIRWRNPGANIVVAVEGVYSMDGDIAPLPEIRALCDAFGAWLAVDDAHGTGVLGARGHGTAEHFGLGAGAVELSMGTFSKVFASTGGFVTGSRDLVDTLRFFARSYMFSAALAPPVVAAVLAGIDFLAEHPDRVRRLHDNVAYFVRGLRAMGFAVDPQTAIIPILVPQRLAVADVVTALHREGVFVNGVEFPAVPRDQQRLRISMMATLTRDHLDHALDRIDTVARRFGFHPEQEGIA